MSTQPPAHPEQEDTWIDANGDMMVYRGDKWVPYEEVPDWSYQEPPVVVRDDGE
jgi:hypothetical protein